MSASVSPKLFATGVQKNPAAINPKVFATGVPAKPAIVNPKIFVTGIPADAAFLTPRIFVTGVDSRETAIADTLRRIQNSAWTGSETAVADTSRRLFDVARADTLRILSSHDSARADTLIRYPRDLIFTASVNSFKDYDVTNFSVTLNERTLSDNFTVETARALNIGDAVKGQLLNYHFSFLVEETSQQGLIQTVRGMYNVDELLYSLVYESEKLKASAYVNKIANAFGLAANVKIQDFTSSRDLSDQNLTYSDLISSLFSWTSQLPQRQINVFIRGGTLHCIQRGYEDSTIDISRWKHSRPTINRKLLRTMWKDANADSSDYSDESDNSAPFSGVISYSDWYSSNEIIYRNGLLVSEKYSTQNNKVASKITTTYEYTSRSSDGENAWYLARKSSNSTTIEDEAVEEIDVGYPSGKNLTKTVVESKVEYFYSSSNDGVYLVKEYEIERKSTYSRGDLSWRLDETETTDRQVTHAPAGNGFYSTSVYVNGVHQGSSLSQGKPSNEVSQYTVDRSYFRTHGESKPELSPIDTTSFPIEETEILAELVESLKWLNRKTKETVSVDIIDKISNGVPTINHIVDFTERVILDGKEYFLVSNQVQFTPRSLIQKLQLVRWY